MPKIINPKRLNNLERQERKFMKELVMKSIFVFVLSFLAIFSLDGYHSLSAREALKSSPTDGTFLEIWREAGLLPKPRSDFGIVVNNNYVYIIGGNDQSSFLRTVYRGTFLEDGAIGDWVEQSSLNVGRSFFSTVAYKGYIYVIGGSEGTYNKSLLDTVERTKILADGSLGEWVIEKNRTFEKGRCKKAVVRDGTIYAVGGWDGTMMTTVERSTIQPDGSLGKWTLEKHETDFPRYIHNIALLGDRIFVSGGHDVGKGSGIAEVEYAQIRKDGALGEWKRASPLPETLFGHSMIVSGEKLMVVGGRNGHKLSSAVFMGTFNPETGEILWMRTTDLENKLEEAALLLRGNHLYVLGGNNDKGPQKRIYVGEIKGGTVGSWLSASEMAAIDAYNTALDMYAGGDVEDAIDWLLECIKRDEAFWDAYYNLGFAYMTQNKPEKAISLMEKLSKKNPDYEDAYILLAIAYDAKKDSDKTIEFIQVAVDKGFGDMKFLINTPDLVHVRGDKRFDALLEDLTGGRFVY